MKAADSITKGRAVRPKTGRVAAIKTTLYELIEAISDVAEPGDETLVNVVVLDLIDSGKIRTSRSSEMSVIARPLTITCRDI
jgi:hypothetical protein